jgi:superfamily II DNA or RNA helicase
VILARGALVRSASGLPGWVEGADAEWAYVIWKGESASRRQRADSLLCGLQPGMPVLETSGPARGLGWVRDSRELAGREQVLVEFWEGPQLVWLPWQDLAATVPPDELWRRGFASGNAEAFRLRQLAHAISSWSQVSGMASALNVDPVPHQIQTVQRILDSGNLNWLLADDVGLGKTIELGLLLHALRGGAGLHRFLLVVPSGLTRQWKEDLSDKFGMEDFVILGQDMRISDSRQWLRYDQVIAPLDLLKSEPHRSLVADSGRWDLIAFDEAHRLTRHEVGDQRYALTERYRLAEQLRRQTDRLILLSGTPHQGKDDQFRGLLELLRPGPAERSRLIQIRAQPGLLAQMVLRNRKAEVVDHAGQPLFKGKTTKTVEVQLSLAELDFDGKMHRYLRQGFSVAQRDGAEARGRAIGFVMTTYRKLATSSQQAILAALQRRQDRLLREPKGPGAYLPSPEASFDDRFVESEEQRVLQERIPEFFRGEQELLEELLQRGQQLLGIKGDSKLRFFLEAVQNALLGEESKLLIFTEYRGTQDYLQAALEPLYPGKVALLNGSMDLEQRRQATSRFEGEARILIATEAGGEGLNLHRRCWQMINYDLPWNPMRLLQRVGRLYRYGQSQPVLVVNLSVPERLDEQVLAVMYERLDQVARDLSQVAPGDYAPEVLVEDVLGELVGAAQLERVWESAAFREDQRTDAQIEAAIQEAREIVRAGRDLLQYASHFDRGRWNSALQLGISHVHAFLRGMAARLGGSYQLHGKGIYRLTLPQEVAKRLGLRENHYLSADSSRARLRGVRRLDVAAEPLRSLLKLASSWDPGALVVRADQLAFRSAVAALLRFQDLSGTVLREDYLVAVRTEGGALQFNPESWLNWLSQPAQGDGSGVEPLAPQDQDLPEQLEAEFARRLGDLHPGGLLVLGGLRAAGSSLPAAFAADPEQIG